MTHALSLKAPLPLWVKGHLLNLDSRVLTLDGTLIPECEPQWSLSFGTHLWSNDVASPVSVTLILAWANTSSRMYRVSNRNVLFYWVIITHTHTHTILLGHTGLNAQTMHEVSSFVNTDWIARNRECSKSVGMLSMEHIVIKVLWCRKFGGRTDIPWSLSRFRKPTLGNPVEPRSPTL